MVSTIPGAKNIPYPEVVERMDELDRERMTLGLPVESGEKDQPGMR